MRYIALFFLLALPLLSFAQADTAAHNAAMEKFVRLYNKGDGNGLCAMFTHTDCGWKRKHLPYKEYGKIESYEFVGFYNNVHGDLAVYRVFHSKAGAKALTFRFREQHFTTFSFDDVSDHIVKLVGEQE